MKLPSPLAVALSFVAAVAAARALGSPTVADRPVGAIPDDRIDDRVVGVVTGPVIQTAHGWGAELDCDVWVWTPEHVEPGDRIAATGRLRTPRDQTNPGAQPNPGRASWELSANRIERLGEATTASASIWRWAGRTQASWAASIDAAVGDRRDPGGAALRGIVTGDRGDVPTELDQRWRTAGIYHALSVSGLHLAVVAGLAFALLRRIAAGSPWGGRIRPARWAAPPALVLAIAYTLVTGAQIATVRALVVVAIALVAQMLDRPIRLVDAIGLAAIALIAWHPADVADPSFQLSFAAALALAVRPKVPPAATRGRRALGWITRGASTSAWVAIVTAPITAYHFHQVAAGGVVGNLVLTPILELIALPAGLAGLALGGRAGAVILASAAWIVGRVDALAGALGHVLPLGAIAVASPVVMAVLVAIGLVLCARARRTRLDAIGWVALCVAWTFARSTPPLGALRVTFLDVGQGDAALIELPDGAAWLVDAGGLPSRGDLASAAAPGKIVTRALEAAGHTSIDLAVISHPHPDHYLGLAALGVPVRELWTAEDTDSTKATRPGPLPTFAEITQALGARVVHPALDVARAEAGVELVAWAPRFRERDGGPEREAADPVRSVNDNSLVVELRYAGRSILFAGDIEREGEEALVAAGVGSMDVVKVAHHGSPTSSSPPFVAATHPSYAVISCGVANSFGFPAPAVVERWTAVGADVMRTDRDGAVELTIDPTGELAVRRFAPRQP